MSYTPQDLQNVNQAISEMAMGNRVGSVTCGGRQIRYAEVSMTELENLRARISAALRKRPRFSQLVSNKGLYP